MRQIVPLLACLALATGCATSPEPMPESGYVLSAPMPATDDLPAETVYPLRAGDWRYSVAEGGEPVVCRRRPTDRYQATWTQADGDRREHFWRLDDAGNLVTTAVIDHDDNALSIFNPPLVAAYASLAPGEQREASSAMRVLDLANPRRQKESGTATVRIHYVEDQPLRTPMGEFTARRVDVEFVADLRLADATKYRTLYVVPELGIVMEQRRERIVVLGLMPKDEQETLVLEGIEE